MGGTQREGNCDAAAMVSFLNAHPAEATAWAGVLGFKPSAIEEYVAELTPVLLRSDTFVTNHGFVDGKAVPVPAVLQAGTAVLVDQKGAPVTKCYCGNPLTASPARRTVTYTGPIWQYFSVTNITIIQQASVTINQFTLVEVSTGDAFDRPRGTDGTADRPPSAQPAPTTEPPTTEPPTTEPPTTEPSTTDPTPSPGATGLTESPEVTGSPESPEVTGSPESPEVTGSPESPEVTGSPRTAGEPSARSESTASWAVGDCYAEAGALNGKVVVRNESAAGARSYDVTVEFGPANSPYGEVATSVKTVEPGQTGTASVTTSAGPDVPDGATSCRIVDIVDDNGDIPTQGAGVEPPADTRPEPAPSAEQPSTEEPPTEEPTAEPSTEEPTTEPPTEEPTTEPPTEEPTTEPPTEEPTTEEPFSPEPSPS